MRKIAICLFVLFAFSSETVSHAETNLVVPGITTAIKMAGRPEINVKPITFGTLT
ncbi:MAG TPA: hypothetical protein PK874_03180 [Desulfobacteraceae bacterium]|nr:hypothetical protein [Desulfobacteraceae bacterium]HPJ66270.1 hypothetical protein [Desulfobacteraceae bacterium]